MPYLEPPPTSKKKDKKPFKETGFGKFLDKAGKIVPTVLDAALDVASGDISGAIDTVTGNLRKEAPDNPEAQKLLQEFEIRKMEYQAELFELEIRDRESARQMQITALQQTDWLSRNFLYLLATFVLLSAVGFGVALLYVEIPEGNIRLVEMFADIYLFVGAIMVLQFFFGSSKGSKDKSARLSENPRE